MPLDGRIEDFVKPAAPDIDLSIFDRAADEIERSGWCQLDERNAAGNVCLVGAFRAMGVGTDMTARAFGAMGFPVHWNARHSVYVWDSSVPTWNDAPGRTKAEVIDRLRRAARGEFV